MKDIKRYKLSSIQVTCIVAANIIGVTVLTLPRLATEKGYANGGVMTLLGGISSILITVFICLLCRRFPNQTIMEFLPDIIGRVPAVLYGIQLTLYNIIVTGGTIRSFSDAVKLTLLPRTPLEFIIVIMLLTSLYLVANGIDTISKISELFLPLIIFSLGLVIVLNIPDVDLTNMRPMLSSSFMSYLKGLPLLTISFLGYEVLFFIIPFMRKPKQSIVCGVIGVSLPTIIYVSLVFIAVGTFGAHVTKSLTYPTLALAKRIVFPGGFLERFDIFFIIFWILAAFSTIGIFNYMSCISLVRLFKMKNYKPFIPVLLPIIYAISILPQNIFHIEMLLAISGILGCGVVLSPLLFYIIAVIRKKGEVNKW